MAINLMLKNTSSTDVAVELVDSYGGNFTAEITAGMSQNESLMEGSNVVVNGNVVHTVSAGDDGQEIIIAE